MKYIDVSNTFLFWHGSPTGVQRVIQGVSRSAESSGFALAVFNPSHRRWYEIPASVMLKTFEPDIFVRSNRRLTRYLRSVALLRPLYKNSIHRFGTWAARCARDRLLVREGRPIHFEPNDTLIVLDDCWSIENYIANLSEVRAREPNLEIIGFVHDLIPLTHPQFSEPSFLDMYEKWISGLLRVSSRILTNSNHSLSELVRMFQGKPSPSGQFKFTLRDGTNVEHRQSPHAVRLGSKLSPKPEISEFDRARAPCEFDLQTQQLGYYISEEQRRSIRESEGWLLCLGSLHPRKNLKVQLDALEPLWKTGEIQHPLIWAGRKGPGMQGVLNRAAQLKSKVIILESIPDALVEILFRGAILSLYTSWTEGFGLPVSESLQRGCPVLASSGGSIPEVAGSIVDYFDPSDAKGLQQLLLKYLKNPAEYSRLKDRAQLFKPYSWEDTLSDF